MSAFARLCLCLGCWVVGVSTLEGDADLEWTAEMINLRYEELNGAQAVNLSMAYATEIAATLGIPVLDVTDVDGRPGRVSLLLPDTSMASSAEQHHDMPSSHAAASTSSVLPTTQAPQAPQVPQVSQVPVEASSETTTTTAVMTTKTRAVVQARPPSAVTLPPLWPLKGIAYGALPCASQTCGDHGLPSRDMAQAGYSAQWSSSGRGDLSTMASLGATAVRMYHTLGLGAEQDHGQFLDEALRAGLNVMPGYHTEMANEADKCIDFDCFDAWKEATLQGFAVGFKAQGGWHNAVAALVIMNEPDFLENSPKCTFGGARCRVKAVISALDGVLAAEKEAGVDGGRVKLTATWSFALRTSIDGLVSGPGIFGFQDIAAAIKDPSIAGYEPRASLADLGDAFAKRWVHSLNTQAPWAFVDEMISKDYARFGSTPWFIGEYGANGQPAARIQSDLESMLAAADRGDGFVGAAFFQFQTAYEKGGSEMNFGLFSLGAEIHTTGEVCDVAAPCASWPVRCLSAELPWLPGALGDRAVAVAAAWQGSIPTGEAGMCTGSPTMQPPVPVPSPSTQEPTALPPTSFPTTRKPVRLPTGILPPLRPMNGIAYGALPCTEHACGGGGLASEDMPQAGYAAQWGPDGRDDLGVMRALGANAVRLYHSFGLDVDEDHGAFLDHAAHNGLNVLPGYHTENANHPGDCPMYDCFDTWKEATKFGLERGFQRGSDWHPAVAMLILLNEPDFFEHAPKCQPPGAWCHVKALVSALDGVLAAEREAGITAGRVKFTVTWSFALRTSIDGKVTGPGVFGFQDVMAGVSDPSIAGYQPRASVQELTEAFRTRWVHGLNTQSPWGFVQDMVAKDYDRFAPIPWFIGEYGGNGMPKAVIQVDLESMRRAAEEVGGFFVGAAMFQFQTTYWKGGAEMNFGLFGLGKARLHTTGKMHDKFSPIPRSWPVYCLDSRLEFLSGEVALRAQAVADAWGGSVPTGRGMCPPQRRLSALPSTLLACRVSAHDGVGIGRDDVRARLDSGSFSADLVRRTLSVIGANSTAIEGSLSVSVHSEGRPDDIGVAAWRSVSGKAFGVPLPWWTFAILGASAGLLAVAGLGRRASARAAVAKLAEAQVMGPKIETQSRV